MRGVGGGRTYGRYCDTDKPGIWSISSKSFSVSLRQSTAPRGLAFDQVWRRSCLNCSTLVTNECHLLRCSILMNCISISVSSLDRSPFYSHISTSLQGLTTIRAYRAENRFKNQYDVYQDNHTAAWFLFMTGSRWLGSRLDFICTVFIASAAFSPLFLAEGGIRK